MTEDNHETKNACFIDDTCKTCGHDSSSHWAGRGKCHECPSKKRCGKFVKNHEEETVR